MKKTVLTQAILIISLAFLTSCGGETSQVADIIEKWHQDNNQGELAYAAKHNEVTFVKDITVTDSINFLLGDSLFIKGAQKQYENLLEEIEASKKLRAIAQAKIDGSPSQQFKDYNQIDVDKFNSRIKACKNRINGLVNAIEGNYSGSDYDGLWMSIRKLKKKGDKTVLSKLYKLDVSTLNNPKNWKQTPVSENYYMLNLDLTQLTYDGPFSKEGIPDENIDIESIHFNKIEE
jgi:hypothetical protein